MLPRLRDEAEAAARGHRDVGLLLGDHVVIERDPERSEHPLEACGHERRGGARRSPGIDAAEDGAGGDEQVPVLEEPRAQALRLGLLERLEKPGDDRDRATLEGLRRARRAQRDGGDDVVVLVEDLLQHASPALGGIGGAHLAVPGDEAHLGLRAAEHAADGAGERALLARLHLGVVGGCHLDHVGGGDEPVPLAVRDDDDGVSDDVTVLGAPGLDLEALADVLEGDGVAIGVDGVNVELGSLRLVGDQELLDALLERVGAAKQYPDLHRVRKIVERLRGGGRERVALVRGHVPAREAARRNDVEQHHHHHRSDHADELRKMRRVDRRQAQPGHQPHLHASTARTVTKSGRTTQEP